MDQKETEIQPRKVRKFLELRKNSSGIYIKLNFFKMIFFLAAPNKAITTAHQMIILYSTREQ